MFKKCISYEKLDKIENRMSHNESAKLVSNAKLKLFKRIFFAHPVSV